MLIFLVGLVVGLIAVALSLATIPVMADPLKQMVVASGIAVIVGTIVAATLTLLILPAATTLKNASA